MAITRSMTLSQRETGKLLNIWMAEEIRMMKITEEYEKKRDENMRRFNTTLAEAKLNATRGLKLVDELKAKNKEYCVKKLAERSA